MMLLIQKCCRPSKLSENQLKGETAIADPKPGAPAMGKCAGQVVLFVFEYLFGVD